MEGPATDPPTADVIEKWLVARMSRATSIPPDEVDVHAPLTRHGLDSVALIALAADLERWLGYRFRANPLQHDSTIDSLAHFLAGELARKK